MSGLTALLPRAPTLALNAEHGPQVRDLRWQLLYLAEEQPGEGALQRSLAPSCWARQAAEAPSPGLPPGGGASGPQPAYGSCGMAQLR